MKRSRDVQLLGNPSIALSKLAGTIHSLNVTSNDDLPHRVVRRGLKDLTLGCLIAELSYDVRVLDTNNCRHGPYPHGHSTLHRFAAQARQPNRISKIKSARAHKRAVLTQRVPCDDVRLMPLGFEDSPKSHPNSQKTWRGVLGASKHLNGTIKDNARQGLSKSFVSLVKGALHQC